MFPKNSVFLSFDSQDALDKNAVQFILKQANIAITKKGFFSLVLSGGNTPIGLYKLLAKEKIDFEKWHIYFGDERCLSIDHLDRNSYVAESIWLSKVNILKSNIHIIPAELGSKEGALKYEKILNKNENFDLVILGLGDDGHIASLFPNDNWDNSKQVVSITNSPKPPNHRISLSPSRLSSTENILFLISGKNKLDALNQWKGDDDIPVKLISAKNQIMIMTFNVI